MFGDDSGLFSFLDDFGDGASGIFSTITDTLGNAADTVSNTFGDIGSFASNIVGTIYEDGKEVILAPSNIINHAIDVGGSVANNLGKDTEQAISNTTANLGQSLSTVGQSFGSSFAWPMAAAAAVAAIIILKK